MTVDTIELECALESITLEDNPPLTEKEKVAIRNKKYFMTENGKKRGTRLLKGIVLNILSQEKTYTQNTRKTLRELPMNGGLKTKRKFWPTRELNITKKKC